MTTRTICLAALAMFIAIARSPAARGWEPPSTEPIQFTRDVLPLLNKRCLECHRGESPKSGFRLDVFDEVLNQVTPGHSSRSNLVTRLTTDDLKLRMPPPAHGPALSIAEQELLRRWINEGLDWDFRRLPSPLPTSDHWAFQTIVRPNVPKSDASPHPIDAFVRRQHQRLGLTANPPADLLTLWRRISLDLTGLPPHIHGGPPGDMAALDARIDQLLRSKAYGEHWGRHWLDLARYAESNGYQHNRDRPHAWPYRD